jgi:hypothetical protein
MTINSLRDVLHAVPFQPFTIRLADGRSVPVPHPGFVVVTGGVRTAIVASHIEDHFTIIDLLLVTQLDVGNTASSVN